MIKFLIFISCLISPAVREICSHSGVCNRWPPISVISPIFYVQNLQVLRSFVTVQLPNSLGKGNPFWDVETDSLYFVDFFGNSFFRYSLGTNTTQTFTVDGVDLLSSFIPIHGSKHRYFVASSTTAYDVYWNGTSDRGHIVRTLFTAPPNTTIDSVQSTANGDLYMGTLGAMQCIGEPDQGFFRYTRANGLQQIASPFKSSVGTVIIDDTLYHMDGCQQLVSSFDLNPRTGALSMSHFQ